jgi:hypothetical protein
MLLLEELRFVAAKQIEVIAKSRPVMAPIPNRRLI